MSDTDSGIVLDSIKNTLLANIDAFQTTRDGLECVVRPLHATKSKDNFASVLYVADLKNDNTEETVSVVVKVMPENPYMRELQNSEEQFFNEDVILRKIVPLMINNSGLQDSTFVSSLFPKCYYASHAADNAMVVLENLKIDGYVLADLTLDYDHCKLALDGLAHFHALSYAMKHSHKDMFQREVIGVVKETRPTNNSRKKFNDGFFKYTAMDPIHFIRNAEDAETVAFRRKHEDFLTKLEEAFQEPMALQERLMIPEEPLTVLCHGDFNRNNIMYRYDDQGKPCQVKFIDFQTVRYSNPGTDLAFFVYFNTSADLRQKHLDDLLGSYQKTVVDCLVQMIDCPRDYLESVYSVTAFREDFERRAVYGYLISAMFIHFMLATVEELQEMDQWMGPQEGDTPPEGFLQAVVGLGGEEATLRSVAIIKEMAEMNCPL